MNKLVKDMLLSRYKSDKHYAPHYSPEDFRRDSRYDSAKYDMGRGDSTYRGQGYADQGYDYERGQQRSGRDSGIDMRRDYGYRDYGDYRRYDRGQDYGQTEYGKMTREDMERWSRSLMNDDGSKGKHFKMEQVEHAVKQADVDVHKYGGMEVFCMAMNMMYADYCKVAKKFGADTPIFYAEMAKAFLDDKDFRGEGEEKLWLYYKCIAEDED